MIEDNLRTLLEEVVGSEYVADEDFILSAYSMDNSVVKPMRPKIVVRPRDTFEVSRIVKVANITKTPMIATGARLSHAGSSLPIIPGILLDMTRMNKVIEINEDCAMVAAQTGITWGKLLYELKKKGWKTGFLGPGSGHGATIGGGISHSSIGWGSCKWGSASDQVLGLEVVLPTGEIVKTGSAANPTSKPFYRYCNGPDITGLFCGDHGIFGVKTEASLRIYPLPEATYYGLFGFQNLQSALKAFKRIQQKVRPENLYGACDRRSAEGFFSRLIKGGVNFPGIEAAFWLNVEGQSRKEVDVKHELVNKITTEEGGLNLDEDLARKYFEAIFDGEMIRGFGNTIFAYHVQQIDNVPELIKIVKTRLDEIGFNGFELYNWIVASGTSAVAFSTAIRIHEKDINAIRSARKFLDEITPIYLAHGGSPYWQGILWWQHMPERLSPQFNIMLSSLKKALDPNHIMNPGAFLIF